MPQCRKHNNRWLIAISAAILAGLLPACKHHDDTDNVAAMADEDILYRMADTVLTVSQVVDKIPQGLEPADSAALFSAIVDDWLFSVLLEHEVSLDYSTRRQIDEQVNRYRRRLLAARYRESVAADGNNNPIAEDSVRAAYIASRDKYVLSSPMVKGILLQLPANTARLADIRAWMSHPSAENIDRIEKVALETALQYEYFVDEWQDWRDIASLVPYRFPAADTYVASHPILETKNGGTVYLLTVTDHLPSGAVMPYEKASQLIRASLMQQRQGETDRALLKRLRDKAIASGLLKVYKTDNN